MPASTGPDRPTFSPLDLEETDMATASPAPTPNPNAMRFQLDVTLPDTINFKHADQASGHPFARAVFEAEGVASVFGVNDFVTVTRVPGAGWDAIVEAVQAAAAEHL
jgi:hypothetical protein